MRTRLPLLLGVLFMASPAHGVDPVQLRFENLPARPGLPDPLVMFDGSKVTTKDEWLTKRRPELKELFQQVMYGRYPAVIPELSAKIVHEDKNAFGGAGTLREVALSVAPNMPPVYVLIAIPNQRSGPVPTFVGLNFYGNHTLTSDPGVRIPDGWMYPNAPGVKNNRATAEGRGKSEGAYPLAQILAKGYAVATAYSGDIIPDNPKLRAGLANLLMPLPPGVQAPDATGAIMAWAWGIHRMVDHVSTLPEIDTKRIAVVGHSRLGKTALLAAAFDDRIALAIPNQAGCGGTAPSRTKNPKAETVARITKSFPHWFAPRFTPFGADVTRLPFDQNALVAICAPRPVLFTNATEDQWADPPGQFEILKAATPVYELLGVEGMKADSFPAENQLLDSRLGYWIRPGTHAMTPADWEIYLRFADRWLK